MKKLIFVIGISLVVGFAAASWMDATFVSPDPQPIEPSASSFNSFDTTAPVEERIRALEQAVIVEQQARQLLEEELIVLREEIERRDVESVGAEQQRLSDRQQVQEALRAQRSAVSPTQARLDRLVAAGFPVARAEWIVQRESELQMERLQARYEAMRGNEERGFFGRGYSRDSQLRGELGEADYERYLTASGRSTAVNVSSVIPRSPAQVAGLLPGDQIVRYDGERVFSMMDIAGRIMESEADGNVVVDIVRDGAPMQLVIPRGPLGVTGN